VHQSEPARLALTRTQVTSAEYARLKEIVAGALARPDSDRLAYLAAQCGDDIPRGGHSALSEGDAP